MSQPIETEIVAVTVYVDRALITRRGTLQLTGDERELVLTGLPLTLQSDSVRAGGSGTVAVRLMGVSTERIYATAPVEAKVAELTVQIEALQAQSRGLQDRLKAAKLERDFVQQLSSESVERFSRGLARQEVGLEQTGALLEFVKQRYGESASAIAQLEQEQRELDKQLTAASRQLQRLQNPRPTESFTIQVKIEPAGAGEFELEVSYMVTRASWKPLYDLYVSSQEQSLNLSYLAEVQQTTGEDWQGVALTLSTAKPGLGTLPPKLAPWYVDLLRTTPLRAKSKSARSADLLEMAGMAAGAAIEDDFRGSEPEPVRAAAPAPVAASFADAAVSKAGSVVTFDVGGNNNIPSDGNPHKVTIFHRGYPVQLQYLAMPRLVSFAYLQAKVTNPETGVTLLPGKANIFRDRAFVGTSELDNIAPGQDFELNLGIDEGLKIERELVERQVDKKLIGGQRRIIYAYRLNIENLLNQSSNLLLAEQIPASRHEKIKVRLNQTRPKIELGEMGVLEWQLTLSPQTKQEVYYQFVIEYPPEERVVGLDI